MTVNYFPVQDTIALHKLVLNRSWYEFINQKNFTNDKLSYTDRDHILSSAQLDHVCGPRLLATQYFISG